MNSGGGEALIALSGAVVGAVIVLGGEWLLRRRDRSSRAKYLASRVVIAIDRYVISCIEALRATPHPLDETTDPDGFAPFPERYHEPDGVDWTSIDDDLAFDLLAITSHDLAIRDRVLSLAEHDSYGAKDLRDELFGNLARELSDYANRLRKAQGLPPKQAASFENEVWLREFVAIKGQVVASPASLR